MKNGRQLINLVSLFLRGVGGEEVEFMTSVLYVLQSETK